MSVSEVPILNRSLFLSLIGLPVGIGLFFALRSLESVLRGSLLVNAVLEEAARSGLFLLSAALRFSLRPGGGHPHGSRQRHGPSAWPPASPWLLCPLLAAFAFGIVENGAYFLRFPTSSIYQRLLYSYPIHVNAGLLYAIAFTSGKPWRLAAFVPIAIGCHFALNTLSLVLPGAGVYAIGIASLGLFGFLVWRMRQPRLERSLEHAGI